MKTLVIQHIEYEPLGTIEAAAPGGVDFSYIRPYRDERLPVSLDGWEALIILGGPMAVYQMDENPYLLDEMRLIEKASAAGIPTLGICLGSQLIAHAAGASVYPGSVREAGWGSVRLTSDGRSDRLFAGLAEVLPVFQLHGDTFDLPAGSVLLASNDSCRNQAFRIGDSVYGLQFHVEVTAELVRKWSDIYDDYIAGAGVNNQDLLSDLDGRCKALEPVAERVSQRLFEIR
jgi:GMP synthase (glutamine-hydrolysing)